jgi:hypothetical protein
MQRLSPGGPWRGRRLDRHREGVATHRDGLADHGQAGSRLVPCSPGPRWDGPQSAEGRRPGARDRPGRSAESELALRAAAALAVRDGASAITVDAHPQRLAREALFLLVFGSRPAIKSELVARLGAAAG